MKKISIKRKKKLLTASAVGLAVLMLLAGTFAWVQIRDERINRMNTKTITDGSVKLDEKFIPNENWEIGTENQKEVSVNNLGDQPVFVRVSYEEVLKVYQDNARQKENSAAWKKGDSDFPVSFDADKYSDAKWTTLTADNITPALPEGVTIKVKASKNEKGVSVESVAYYKHEDLGDKFQKMSLNLSATDYSAENVSEWTFNATDFKYFVYSGIEYKAKDWAGNNVLLGTKGEKYGVGYDYEYTTLGVSGTSVPRTLATGAQIPQIDSADASRWTSKMQADTELDSALYAVYNATAMTDTSSLEEGKWVYNPEDGYFYYLNALESGNGTPVFLQALGFANNASGSYSDMQFDLVVNLEAIQAVKAALTDAAGDNGGWAMSTEEGSTTKKIVDLLTTFASKNN